MTRILSGIILLLLQFQAYAQSAPEPPAESNLMGTAIFGVLFVGLCVGFGWMVWKNDKNQKKKAKESEHHRTAGPAA
jgi:hypothetical protein